MIYKEPPPDHHSREGFVHIQKSYFNLNNNPRLQLHRKPIVPNDNLLKPPPGKALVKLGKLGILLLDELVQLVDTLYLLVTDGGVGEVLLFHLTKAEYLLCFHSLPSEAERAPFRLIRDLCFSYQFTSNFLYGHYWHLHSLLFRLSMPPIRSAFQLVEKVCLFIK